MDWKTMLAYVTGSVDEELLRVGLALWMAPADCSNRSLPALDYGGLRGQVKLIERRLLRVQSDVRVALEHPSRKVAGDRFDHVVRFAGFQEPGDDRVPLMPMSA